ncbi:Tripartite tricarboxylate transporter family receptor [Variovorax boronicumulans]|uniref:tripartite tricarboxylate transporter substrate binding protein n=1 Tax=Variovorax boronicumulans TaxID=436515 RepID=UPI000BB3226D|nr:tripartite tricarboxylate transporter substrate binding protein [Variovorax boronicumulans]PBI85832.1 Tripartite tricarboxylate transporter family receptor [Variovorax boronicumulans]
MRFLTRTFATLLVAASAAAAHAWPDQPVTLVVPYTPGTGIDLIARQLSARLPAVLGQPVIVENLAGASGNIGSEKVARAKPDGYTLLVQVNTLVMNKGLYKSLAYDPVADFTPVSQTSWGTLLLVTNPATQKAGSLAQLVATAKANPGKLTYATPGVGTPHHLSMALLMQGTGTDLLHVPYKGTAGAVTDLLGGRIDAMFLPVHVALQHIQAGKLKALATGSSHRLPQLPDVPTLAEAGVTADNVDMWYGVLAPKGTPANVVARLNTEIAAVLKSPEVAKSFESQGMVPASSTPAAFGALIQKDAQRWATVVKKGNITAD